LNHARSVAEARAALELLGMFPQTVIVGDRATIEGPLRAAAIAPIAITDIEGRIDP